MADYGITPEGFNRKRLNQLLEELNSEVKAVFGENFNVSPESPDGQINGIISESNANLWEIAEEAYNSFNPAAATGATLSSLVQLNGIQRLAATYSRVQLSLTGTPGTLIPIDSLVSTSDTGDIFATETTITLDAGGSGVVFAKATVIGPVIALSGTLTEIETPITGWNAVTNSSAATVGTNVESDVQLRARRERSISRDAQAVIDAIFSGVANIDGVTQTVVLENDTDSVDANGLPAHSFQTVVVGGDDTEIANTIWLKKPAGIQAFGSTTVEVLDSQGLPHNISFSRPTLVPIYVELDITTFADFPSNGEELIKQAIVDYANGELISGRGFGLSEDVIYSRLYTPINTVEGHEIDALRIDVTPSPVDTDNIEIGATETSYFTTDNIEITIL